jgi:hypothetical protein
MIFIMYSWMVLAPCDGNTHPGTAGRGLVAQPVGEGGASGQTALPARPLHHSSHHIGIAGHLLRGDRGMHQEHQAGFTKQAGYW